MAFRDLARQGGSRAALRAHSEVRWRRPAAPPYSRAPRRAAAHPRPASPLASSRFRPATPRGRVREGFLVRATTPGARGVGAAVGALLERRARRRERLARRPARPLVAPRSPSPSGASGGAAARGDEAADTLDKLLTELCNAAGAGAGRRARRRARRTPRRPRPGSSRTARGTPRDGPRAGAVLLRRGRARRRPAPRARTPTTTTAARAGSRFPPRPRARRGRRRAHAPRAWSARARAHRDLFRASGVSHLDDAWTGTGRRRRRRRHHAHRSGLSVRGGAASRGELRSVAPRAGRRRRRGFEARRRRVLGRLLRALVRDPPGWLGVFLHLPRRRGVVGERFALLRGIVASARGRRRRPIAPRTRRGGGAG